MESPKITKHFTWRDASCKCGKCGPMPDTIIDNVVELAERLEKVVVTANKLVKKFKLNLEEITLTITSWYRCYSKDAHGLGLAVDISCRDNVHRYLLIAAAIICGFNRIGTYVLTTDRKIIHLDIDNTNPLIRPPYQLWVES